MCPNISGARHVFACQIQAISTHPSQNEEIPSLGFPSEPFLKIRQETFGNEGGSRPCKHTIYII
ncbi:hypothetical protein AGR7C_Lc80137 [Agrobacterium deltaense Zutra 3/1]|uniref:Uncharacterized protein n=1 Tax=Agrobacterium deltaense Zutra 3/1 TaxID=1183427 RepID=A0A1S7RYZ8_9HYPH|nr:hypothetical protein AGR7C_Lc80137 [Agrobacterium deltaense Zutra 3/1]